MPDTELLTAKQASALVSAKMEELGGPTKSAAHWDCSVTMVHMVARGARLPTKTMLKEVGLEVAPQDVMYRRVKSNG